ncbi:MAG TPA: ankyrin repeat domain-containing protein [Terriglobia bacterium]|nr:ankyrin repeat domain-containing protein [Terriglobia bacterium]
MRLKLLWGWSMLSLLWAANLSAAGAGLPLVEAARKSDTATVRALLKKGVDVNVRDLDGTTALYWAAYENNSETAELLIRAGADVKAANRYGVAPLYLASVNGSAVLIEMLLKAGADANAVGADGETMLMTASRTGKPEAVKALLAHGANPNAKESRRGQTALMWAAAEGHAEVVKALAEGGADIRARANGGFTPYLFAVREGHIDAVRALLAAGADINESLPGANARRRATGVVAAPNSAEAAGGPSALVVAVANAHFELASVLLDASADPNAAAQGWTALHQLTWVRKPGEGTNDPAPQGSGKMDSIEITKRLVAHGANVNARMTKRGNAGVTDLNMMGATPFLMAARAGDAEFMRLLAQLGADPLLPNSDNTPPLTVAAGVGTRSPGEDAGTETEALEAVKAALELGGNLDAVDNNGETAMHGAAYKFLPSVVRFLAEKGARIEVWNKPNKLGYTPLKIAAEGFKRETNMKTSPVTAAAIREVMNAAGQTR